MDYFSLFTTIANASPVKLSDRISFAAIVCSFIFFLISLSISLKAYHESKRSADASEKSANAAVLSARSSVESVFIAEKSADAGLRSAVAAEQSSISSQEANTFAKKQTELLETDLHNTYSPKLLPIHSIVKIPKSEIHNAFNHKVFWGKEADIKLEVANVSNGNAYMVSSWLEIGDASLMGFHEETSPFSYDDTYDAPYSFNVEMSDQYTVNQLSVIFKIKNNEFTVGANIDVSSNRVPVLRCDETMEIFLPDYVVAILAHAVYTSWLADPEYLERRMDTTVFLRIKYKVGTQLESENYMARTYKLLFSDLTPISKRKVDEYNNTISREVIGFNLSIDFNFIEEREVVANLD